MAIQDICQTQPYIPDHSQYSVALIGNVLVLSALQTFPSNEQNAQRSDASLTTASLEIATKRFGYTR